MTTNHIDQLAEWWSEAEHAPFRKGDVLIARYGDRPMPFEIYPAGNDSDIPAENVRILVRAPKPKPAWHDAVAVIAHTARFSERRPFALTHTEDVLDPYNVEWITRDDLIDPAPLIEAKVTDEMVRTVLNCYYEMDGVGHDWPADTVTLMRLALAAALGLETE